jgi:hypothetical protein
VLKTFGTDYSYPRRTSSDSCSKISAEIMPVLKRKTGAATLPRGQPICTSHTFFIMKTKS